MKVGIDLDNTVIDYSGVFYQAGLEKGLFPKDIGRDKASVKYFLCNSGKEGEWTELQGYVYGARLELAKVYDDFAACILFFNEQKIDYCIISHKTKYPFKGPQYDLHAQAERWITQFLIPQIGPMEHYFCEKIDSKLLKIEELGCDYFIDDLPSILNHEAFPEGVHRLLFSKEGSGSLMSFKSWREVKKFFRNIVELG